MLNRNTQYYEWLLPYLEGGLDEARRAQLEARLAADPALAAEAKRLARTLGGLRGAASRSLRPENASVPADLWPHLRARLVLDPVPRPRPRAWWLAGVGAPATAALIVAAIWLPGWHPLVRPELASKTAARPTVAPAPPAPSGVPSPSVVPPRPVGVLPTSAEKLQASAPNATRPTPAVPHADPFALSLPPRSSAGGRTPAPAAAAVPAGVTFAPLPRPPLPGVSHTLPPHQDTLSHAIARPLPASPALPSMPAPAKLMPPSPAAAATDEAGNGLALKHGGPTAAGAVTETIPKQGENSPDGSAPQTVLSSPNTMPPPPRAMFGPAGQPLHSARKAIKRPAPPGEAANAFQAFALNGAASLDSEQSALAATMRPPLWGENEGEMQANQALMSVRESGMLDDLRAHLEARRAQSPHDLVMGRMLAAVYESGFSSDLALHERRRIVGLEGAGGEDWYMLARTEERAGNGSAARAAYRHALESPIPPSSFHAAIARGK